VTCHLCAESPVWGLTPVNSEVDVPEYRVCAWHCPEVLRQVMDDHRTGHVDVRLLSRPVR
jgi:hypothetical protein